MASRRNLVWTLISDIAPKSMVGLTGGVFSPALERAPRWRSAKNGLGIVHLGTGRHSIAAA